MSECANECYSRNCGVVGQRGSRRGGVVCRMAEYGMRDEAMARKHGYASTFYP